MRDSRVIEFAIREGDDGKARVKMGCEDGLDLGRRAKALDKLAGVMWDAAVRWKEENEAPPIINELIITAPKKRRK